VTPTSFSVPPAAVTVIPRDGSAALVPFSGVIVTTGPDGDGEGDAEAAGAVAAAPVPAPWPAPLALLPGDCAAAGFPAVLALPPVQAVTAAISPAAATAEITRIALMPTLYEQGVRLSKASLRASCRDE
jgi:hypothetical protein